MKFKLFFIFLIFISCQSQNKIQIETNSRQPPKALVLYASDNPEKFLNFIPFFTENLNQEKIFHAWHSREINELWIANSPKKEVHFNLENKINEMTNELKHAYKNKQFEKLVALNSNFENQFFNLLSQDPKAIKLVILTEFYFWNAVAEAHFHSKSNQALQFYQKYTPLSEKNLFELGLDSNTLNYLHTKNTIKQKKIKIFSKNTCLVYVNGIQIKNSFVLLPENLKSILVAKCEKGMDSQIFLPSSLNSILIHPTAILNLPQAIPTLDNRIKNRIQSENAAYILLIYWSQKNKYLEAQLLEKKFFHEIKKREFLLNEHADFERVENELIVFLKGLITELHELETNHESH